MTIHIAGHWVAWIATALFVVGGVVMMKPKSDWDFFSGIFGMIVAVGGTLVTWLIYFMVAYFSKT
jgi:hypothetical protein